MIPEISREGPLCTHEHAELRTCRLRPPHRPYRLQPSRPPEFHRSGARQVHPCAPKGSKDRSDRPYRRSWRPALLGNHARTSHPAISAATTPPRPRRDGPALHRRRPRPGLGGEGGGPACPRTPSAHSHGDGTAYPRSHAPPGPPPRSADRPRRHLAPVRPDGPRPRARVPGHVPPLSRTCGSPTRPPPARSRAHGPGRWAPGRTSHVAGSPRRPTSARGTGEWT